MWFSTESTTILENTYILGHVLGTFIFSANTISEMRHLRLWTFVGSWNHPPHSDSVASIHHVLELCLCSTAWIEAVGDGLISNPPQGIGLWFWRSGIWNWPWYVIIRVDHNVLIGRRDLHRTVAIELQEIFALVRHIFPSEKNNEIMRQRDGSMPPFEEMNHCLAIEERVRVIESEPWSTLSQRVFTNRQRCGFVIGTYRGGNSQSTLVVCTAFFASKIPSRDGTWSAHSWTNYSLVRVSSRDWTGESCCYRQRKKHRRSLWSKRGWAIMEGTDYGAIYRDKTGMWSRRD